MALNYLWIKTPINVVMWNSRPTANCMLSIAFAPDAPLNDTLWNNERMGELLIASHDVLDFQSFRQPSNFGKIILEKTHEI